MLSCLVLSCLLSWRRRRRRQFAFVICLLHNVHAWQAKQAKAVEGEEDKNNKSERMLLQLQANGTQKTPAVARTGSFDVDQLIKI